MCDPSHTNYVGRDHFYKSLALVALAQQGKSLDDKVLLNYTDKGRKSTYLNINTYLKISTGYNISTYLSNVSNISRLMLKVEKLSN